MDDAGNLAFNALLLEQEEKREALAHVASCVRKKR